MKKIPLTKGRFAFVDDEDYEELSKFKWCYSIYAIRFILVGYKDVNKPKNDKNCIRKKVWMHRAIIEAPDGMEVDHINGDPLDNRRSNLRICTHKENLANAKLCKRNKIGYKGVHQERNGWGARIVPNGKEVYLGWFKDKKLAAEAYNKAAVKYFGEFARTNILRD